MFACFAMNELNYKMKKNYYSYINNHVCFRIPESKNILNAMLRCLDPSFSIEGLLNFNR